MPTYVSTYIHVAGKLPVVDNLTQRLVSYQLEDSRAEDSRAEMSFA